MKELLKEIREKTKACGNKTKEDRARKGAYVDCILAIKKQLALCNVSCSLPSKEELFSVCEKIVEEKHKGLDEIQKEYIKLGFMYYHRYLSDRNKK